MIELLFSFLIILGFYFLISIPLYKNIDKSINCIKGLTSMCICIFKFLYVIYYYLGLIDNYKNHSLWDEKSNFNPMPELKDYPIKELNGIYINETFIKLDYKLSSIKEYSLIKTDDYPKQCLQNFFINEYEDCPITNIIIENKGYLHYLNNYKKIKINEKKYLYFTNNDKNGQIYFGNERLSYLLDFSDNFSYKKFKALENIVEILSNSRTNPFMKLKKYSYYMDNIIIAIIILSCILEFSDIIIFCRKYNKDKILKLNLLLMISFIIDILVSILLFIRFVLFIKIKHFLLDYEEFYEDKSIHYFPNKYINFDGFPSVIIFENALFQLITIIIYNKIKKINIFDSHSYLKDNEGRLVLLITVISGYITFFIFDNIYYYNSNYNYYKELKYNWGQNPIKNIEISPKENYEIASIHTKYDKITFYDWRNNFFKIERLNDFDYFNTLSSNNKPKKRCGKDSIGNYLYFPEKVECPINHIFVGYSPKFAGINKTNLDNYKVLNLGNRYLYFTNNYTEGEILIDLKASTSGFQLNLEKTNEICYDISLKHNNKDICKPFKKIENQRFYSMIDYRNNTDTKLILYNKLKDFSFDIYFRYLSLFRISYLGLNSSNINNMANLIYLKKSEDLLYIFFISKIILFSINIISTFIIFCFLSNKVRKKCYCFISIIFIFFEIILVLINLFCSIINIKYIKILFHVFQNFIWEKLCIANLFLLIFDIIILLINIIMTLYTFGCEKNSLPTRNVEIQVRNNENKNNENNNNNANNNNINNKKIINIDNNNDNNNMNINNIDNLYSLESTVVDKANQIINNIDKSTDIFFNRKTNIFKYEICALCKRKISEITISPCDHKCLCMKCYNQNKDILTTCPKCKKNIIKFVENNEA